MGEISIDLDEVKRNLEIHEAIDNQILCLFELVCGGKAWGRKGGIRLDIRHTHGVAYLSKFKAAFGIQPIHFSTYDADFSYKHSDLTSLYWNMVDEKGARILLRKYCNYYKNKFSGLESEIRTNVTKALK